MRHVQTTHRAWLAAVLGLGLCASGVSQANQPGQRIRIGMGAAKPANQGPLENVDPATLVAGTKVRLKATDAPLADVLGDLSRQAKIALFLAQSPADLGKRPVTLDTGETTFWEALDALCRQAKVHLRSGIQTLSPSGDESIADVPSESHRLVVDDGAAAERPTAYIGSVRLRLLPYRSYAKNSGAKNERWIVEALAEPKAKWQGALSLAWEEATGGDGQRLAALPAIHTAAKKLGGDDDGAGMGDMGNLQKMLMRALNIGGAAIEQEGEPQGGKVSKAVYRQEIHLKWNLPEAVKSASLRGKLKGKVLARGIAVVVPDASKAGTKAVAGKEDVKLTIDEQKRLKDGKTEMQLAIEKPDFGNEGGGVRIQIAGGNQGETLLPRHGFKIWDSQNRPYKITAYHVSNEDQVTVYRLVLDPPAKDSKPMKIEYSTSFPHGVEKPFALREASRP